ncbi:hypothetical protein [Planktothrix tepida]
MDQALKSLPGWVVKEGKLYKKFEFHSFNEAIMIRGKIKSVT